MLRIANPQSTKRLGHFLTADCKSAGTPGGGLSWNARRVIEPGVTHATPHLKTPTITSYSSAPY